MPYKAGFYQPGNKKVPYTKEELVKILMRGYKNPKRGSLPNDLLEELETQAAEECEDEDRHDLAYIRKQSTFTKTGRERKERVPRESSERNQGLLKFHDAWSERKRELGWDDLSKEERKGLYATFIEEYRSSTSPKKPKKTPKKTPVKTPKKIPKKSPRKKPVKKYKKGFTEYERVRGIKINDKKEARRKFLERHEGELSESALRKRFVKWWKNRKGEAYRGQGY